VYLLAPKKWREGERGRERNLRMESENGIGIGCDGKVI
jgi:hypothetical protein